MYKCVYNRIIRLFIFILISLLSVAHTAGQDSLEKQFQQFQLPEFQEKVFVHVDKSFYLAGEIIWFKVYNVDGYFNKPLNSSGISYVEILSTDQKPVLQASIDMKDGKGNGSFTIPVTFPTGNYILRAYTSWMKNFNPGFYFHQSITVVNTLNQATATPAAARLEEPAIQFFPEGGNLVYGLSSKLAFKAEDQYGNGLYCKGIVLNQKKDTVARFQASQFGMGNFPFTPRKGDTYYALVDINDSTIIKKLPQPYDQGYIMNLTEMNEFTLRITIHSNITSANPTVYLFAHTRHLVKSFQVNQLANNEASFYIDKKRLGDGVSHITIFNAYKSPVCERLYFKQPEKQLNIQAKTAQSAYTTRSKIDIALSTTDQSGRPVAADMSMAVFWIDSLQSIPQENILNYLLLTADLKGKIESPLYYFENSGAVVSAAMDNLMLTQGWTRFRWEEVLQNKKPFFEFLPEPDGPVINGKVIDKRTGLPAPGVTGYLSLPGKYFEFSSAMSKPDGSIRFNVKKFYGNNEIIVQTNTQTDSNYRIDITSPFSDKFSSSQPPAFLYPKKWESQLLYRSVNTQVENTYLIHQKHRFLPAQAIDSFSFYGRPDQKYYLDDYTRFITLEEVMREYVLDVRIRQQSGKFQYRIRNTVFNIYFEDDPLLLLDGIPVFDADKIMAMDPLKIQRIDVVARKFYTGPLVNDGIVSYKTYEGDLAGYQLDPNAVALQYNGLQQQREFYSPAYDTPAQVESPLPDFRNLLDWSPEIKTDSEGKKQFSFYTSDLTGKFALIVQGITDEGLPGSKILTFTVSK